MTIGRLEMLGIAQAEREALGRTVQYTPPDRWEADSACAGWRNRDVLAHLAAQEVAAAAILGEETPTEVEEYLKSRGEEVRGGWTLPVDEFNEFAVSRRRDAPFRQVVMEWGRAADLLLARVSKIPEAQWVVLRVPWVAGDIPVRYLIQSRISEWWIHGEDIRAGAELPVRLEHWPIYAVNDLAIRMIPYALGRAALSYPGMSVQVDLEGAGGGSWHYGLAPREAPEPGKRPDVFIDGRAYPFAMIAARRVPASYYVDDGTIAIGGDAEVGLDILEHIRVFT